MYCDNCGTANKTGAKFCVKCGNKLISTEKPKNTAKSSEKSKDDISRANNSISKNTIIGAVAIVIVIVLGLVAYIGTQTPPKPNSLLASCSAGTCEVNATCTGQYTYNNSRHQCDYKYAGATGQAQSQQCQGTNTCTFNVTILPMCPDSCAAVVNTNNCKCEAPLGESPSTACASGYIYQNATGYCVPSPSCPNNYYFNSSLGRCVLYDSYACPTDYSLSVSSGQSICVLNS